MNSGPTLRIKGAFINTAGTLLLCPQSDSALAQFTDFPHIWTSSPPCRGPAVRWWPGSGGFRKVSPVLRSRSPSPESGLSSSSIPRSLK